MPRELRGAGGPQILAPVLSAAIALLAAGALAGAGAAPAATSVPTVTGPVTGGTHGFPYMSSALDLSRHGYVEEEYLVSGTATAYTSAVPLTADGAWDVTADGTAPYTTRILVRKPVDPKRFNGTVILEWLNVTAGNDFTGDWFHTRYSLMRRGYAYVGVSAQYVGVQGPGPNSLQNWESGPDDRYASLSHPGDSFSYDIFSQVAKALRQPGDVDPLAGLEVERLLAEGLSQSASRLVTYYNAVQPREGLFDGFLVHSRSGGAAALRQGAPPAQPVVVPAPNPVRFRADVEAPVLLVQTETDVIGYFGARQPDSLTFRDWEVAGAAHADAFWQTEQAADSAKSNGSAFMIQCDLPINAGLTHHWVMEAAQVALTRWLENGVAPTTAARLEAVAGPPVTLLRDPLGNVLGGIRLPDVEAPLMALSGTGNSGPPPLGGFCFLYGTTTPFGAATIDSLYPNHGTYVTAYTRAAHAAVDDGFLLPEAARELVAAAARSDVGR